MESVVNADILPDRFERRGNLLPVTQTGLANLEEFKKSKECSEHIEWLKSIGLSDDQIDLYQENEAGIVNERAIEADVLRNKLREIYKRIKQAINNDDSCSHAAKNKPGTSRGISLAERLVQQFQRDPIHDYPEGHPMHEIVQIEKSLFGHLSDLNFNSDGILPINKRRKILRRLKKRADRLYQHGHNLSFPDNEERSSQRTGTLWDIKKLPRPKLMSNTSLIKALNPKKPVTYTIKLNKIVPVEPVPEQIENEHENNDNSTDNVQAVNCDNSTENVREINRNSIDNVHEDLLEGMKMSVDDIKKIDRFKNYEPGIPSKVLFLKNIAPSVTEEQLSLLFNQFVLDNGGPIDLRLMTGRMRGQAFARFQIEDIAIRALDEINGTIVSGRPIIAVFGRANGNETQDDN